MRGIRYEVKYECGIGEVMEINVPSEVEEVCIEIEGSTQRQERKEIRRHISLSVLESKAIQVSENIDIKNETIELVKIEYLKEALKMLLLEQ